jgi:hypothetical protein
MKARPEDDWGKPLGSDPDAPAPVAKKKPARQETLTSLIYYFNDILPQDVWGNLNSPVNAKALLVGLRKLKNAGHSIADIKSMMNSFVAGLQVKPLPVGVAPWRGFLANLDALASKVQATSLKEPDTYDDLQPDTRIV